MENVRYYLAIFSRRLPIFLVITTIAAAVSYIVARNLPAAYEVQARLIVESPQIPANLAASTVATPAVEQLQIIQQRLMTRPNLLKIAAQYRVMPNQAALSPDDIVNGMRARTNIRTNAGRGQATLMTITFEAVSAKAAAGVVNDYLTLIQESDLEYRKGRAGQTLEFFEREVERLSGELEERTARILEFKQANSDALPTSLVFRETQRATLQNNLDQINQQIFSLQAQREKLLEIYNSTGQVVGVAAQNRTPEEVQLQQLRTQLQNDLVVYSPSNPKIKLLEARIASLENIVSVQQAQQPAQPTTQTGNSTLDIQLAQIESQISTLEDQKVSLEERLAKLTDSIERTPAVQITLDDLTRDYNAIQGQYNTAVTRLATASTGERIEERSRGQRISVIEQPSVPTRPTKPNRMLIAAGGTGFGIALGFALIFLLELLNRTARRPEDIVRALDITPLATIPYVQSRSETLMRRASQAAVLLVIVVGIPVGVWAIHTYYQPLDLIADRAMSKLGVRW